MQKILALAALFLLLAPPLHAQEVPWSRYEEEAVRQLQAYLRIDTTNPPGNELAAARFFQEWFTREGIPVEVYEFAPGRANLIARLRGEGSKRPLILLNHMDVVSSDPERWRVPPFSGALVDGDIYGRGALDMKGEGLLQAMVFVLLHRLEVPLQRDVLFVATSDEEVGMAGAQWLIANHRATLAQAEYLITEGGFNLKKNGVKYFGVDTAEKAPFWLRLRARGRPGHGSRPLRDSASNRLVRALARVLEWETPIKILPVAEKFFRDLAPLEPSPRNEQFRNLRQAIEDPEFRRWVTKDEMLNFLLRNTVSLTVLQGAKQTNVIPGEAIAHLDVRLLPEESHEAFLRELRRVLADDTIEIELIQDQYRPANSSPIDTELFRTIERAAARHSPGAIVTTRMLSGYTESALFRQLGIICYGFSPFVLTREENASVHGDNERVSVENVRRGLRLLYDIVAPMVQ